MKHIILYGLVSLVSVLSLWAGDSAVLVDRGFSSDGNYYIFGQYGRTDKDYEGWAEIYTVDVLKNDYVPSGVFKTRPSCNTIGKTGKELYGLLDCRNSSFLGKYNCKDVNVDNILYIRDCERKTGEDVILFKDFISSISSDSAFYKIQLKPSFKGSGECLTSSFLIQMEKQDSSGNVLASQTIGNPDIWRKNIEAYKIERIVCSKDGKNLVFIIEKQMQDKTGVNIRYMIEACKLKPDFFIKLID